MCLASLRPAAAARLGRVKCRVFSRAEQLDEKHKIYSLLATIKVCKETRQNFTLLTHSEGLYGCIEHTPMKIGAAAERARANL